VRADEEFQTAVKASWDDKLDPLFPDRYILFRDMVENDLTPWVAARRRADTKESTRSMSTLYYVARKVVEAIRERFSVTHEECVRAIRKEGRGECGAMLSDDVRAALKAEGYEFTEVREMRVFHTFTVTKQPLRSEGARSGSAA